MKRPLRHQLDKILRERLEDLQSPFQPGHWDRMEEQLNNGILDEEVPAGQPEPNYQELDTALFDKLHNYHAPYQATHWPKMAEKLRLAFHWPEYVLRYKVLEVALMLLLFMGLWQHFPQPSPPADIQAFRIPTLPAGQQPVSSTDEQPLQSTVQETAAASSDNKIESAVGSPLATAFADAPKPSVAGSKAALPLPSNVPQPIRYDASQYLKNLNLVPSAAKIPYFSEATVVVAPVESRGPSPLLYEDDLLQQVRNAKSKRRTILRLAMFGNGEFNHILVPASEDKRLSESFERAAFGYGSGLSLGADFGRFEIGAGLVYAARSYPVGLLYLEGSVAGGFEGDELRTTELNIVSLPLHFRYNLIRKDKWRGYLLAGGAVQVAFQTNYYTADAPAQFNFQPAMPIYSDGGESTEKAIDRIRQNGVGWFEGGSFEDNAYLTANLGFGVERYINERWSLFAQPVYQYSFHYFKNIDGLGPNNDRINSLSLFLGTRVRLR